MIRLKNLFEQSLIGQATQDYQKSHPEYVPYYFDPSLKNQPNWRDSKHYSDKEQTAYINTDLQGGNRFFRGVNKLEKINAIMQNPTAHGFTNTAKDQKFLSQARDKLTKALDADFPNRYREYRDSKGIQGIKDKGLEYSNLAHASHPKVAKDLVGAYNVDPEISADKSKQITLTNMNYNPQTGGYDELDPAQGYGGYVPSMGLDDKTTKKIKQGVTDSDVISTTTGSKLGLGKRTATENKNIKNSRKQLIENYIDLRCKKLQEEARLDEFGFDDIKKAASGAFDAAKNVKNKAFDAAKNVKNKAFDAASDIKNKAYSTAGKVAKNVTSTAKDIGSTTSKIAKDAYGTAKDVGGKLRTARDSALDYVEPVMGHDAANLAYLTPLHGLKVAYDAADVGATIDNKGLKAGLAKTADKIGGGVDALQTGLDVVGMAGAVNPLFNIADAANVGISGARAGIEGLRGNTDASKKHAIGAGLATAAMVPYIGDFGAGLTKLGARWGPTAVNVAKSIGNNPYFKTAKYTNKVAKQDDRFNQGKAQDAVADAASNAVDTVSTNLAGWGQDGPFSSLYNYFTGD